MLLCERLQKKMDGIWTALQQVEREKYERISQIELDELCVEKIENFVSNIVKKRENALAKG